MLFFCLYKLHNLLLIRVYNAIIFNSMILPVKYEKMVL